MHRVCDVIKPGVRIRIRLIRHFLDSWIRIRIQGTFFRGKYGDFYKIDQNSQKFWYFFTVFFFFRLKKYFESYLLSSMKVLTTSYKQAVYLHFWSCFLPHLTLLPDHDVISWLKFYYLWFALDPDPDPPRAKSWIRIRILSKMIRILTPGFECYKKGPNHIIIIWRFLYAMYVQKSKGYQYQF